LRLSPEECEQYFWAQILRIDNFMKNLFVEHATCEITYEDLTADREAALGPVWEFLGVQPSSEARITLRRQNPQPIRELVENFDDLKRHFEGTPFEPHFRDEG
jgi:hypothetical protein